MAIDPKKAALIILAKKKQGDSAAPPDAGPDSMDGSDPSDGEVSAMEDFIAAVKDGDAKAACKAWDAYESMDSDDEG